MSQTYGFTSELSPGAFGAIRDAFAGLAGVINTATQAFRRLEFSGYREVPVHVARSGPRPVNIGRAEWSRRRRLDLWRRRRNRRHGTPTRPVFVRTVIPHAHVAIGEPE